MKMMSKQWLSKWRFVWATCVLLLSQTSAASIYSTLYRIQQHSALSHSHAGAVTLDYHWTIQDWDTTPGSSSSMLANPCYGLSACTIGINLAQQGLQVSGLNSANPQCYLTAAEGSTRVRSMGELGELYKRKCSLPISGTIQTTQRSVSTAPECVGLFYAITAEPHASNAKILPGSRCTDVAPRLGYCEFGTSQLNLNHGVLTPAQISSGRHSVSDQIVIGCTVDSTAQVFLNPSSTISLGSGISSSITSNNRPINAMRFYVPRWGGIVVPITSTLSSTGNVTGGRFSGSGTLIVGIP